MHFLLSFVTTLCLASLVSGYIYTIPNATDPEHPGHCYHTQTQLVIKPGATLKLPGNCETVKCNEDFSIVGVGCGMVMPARPRCKYIPQDTDKPFPECCGTTIC